MLLKDLLLITFGGGGFLGLMGTSGYFVYRQEAIKNVERDISKTLGEINEEVQKLIGKKVDNDGNIVTIDSNGKTLNDNETSSTTSTLSKEEKTKKIEEIQNLIKKAKDKNKNWWSLYVSGVEEITKKYTEIVDNEKENKYEKLVSSKSSPKPKAPKQVAKNNGAAKPAAPKSASARPIATKTEATKTEATKTA